VEIAPDHQFRRMQYAPDISRSFFLTITGAAAKTVAPFIICTKSEA